MDVLKTLGEVAGIGGIVVGALVLIFRDIIRKNIFPNLAKQQSFRLLVLIVILAWSIAVLGIVAWAYVQTAERKQSSESLASDPSDSGGEREYQIAGLVTDGDGKGLPNVSLSLIGRLETTETTTSGNFTFSVRTRKDSIVGLRAVKDDYVPWTENIKVPDANVRIKLERPAARSTPSNQIPAGKPKRKSRGAASGIIQQESHKPSSGA
jgi:hypothetical protein